MRMCWLAMTLAALVVTASAATPGPYPPLPSWKPDPVQRALLQRSLALLEGSTPTNRRTVRILFYGQSITQQAWWKEVERYLRTTYPNADVIIENRAIGGHSSQLLVKTAEADLYPFQPDLLIFHVYGSHIDYEKIIQRVRERTCADILLQTDHITTDESLAEETDPAKLTPKQWDAWMNHAFLPATAAKYGACRADIHERWKDYLKLNHLKASDLLKDGVHLNAHGEWLMAELLKAYLAPLSSEPKYDPMNDQRVRTIIPPISAGQEHLRLEFKGSRVDLIFKQTGHAKVNVKVDGKPPSTIPELYGFTRTSAFPNSDWPVLLQVASTASLDAETWSLKIGHASADGKLCQFTLSGSATGEDGMGSSTNHFVSKSRCVVIEPDDWNLGFCIAVFKRPLPDNFTVTWSSVLRGTDTAQPPETTRGIERSARLAQGLTNGHHVLELEGDLQDAIKAVRIYCPDGRAEETNLSK